MNFAALSGEAGTPLSQLQPAQQTSTHQPSPPRRMSLSAVRKGPQKTALRVLVYGVEKIGKSTFAAGAPRPIFLGRDSGTEQLDIERLPQPETWAEVLEGLNEVERNGRKMGYETLVVDPVNWLEPLVQADVTGDVNTPLSALPFGKGADGANARWRTFIAGLERVWLTGMHVVLLAHAQVKKFEDPEGPGFERWELAMNAKAAQFLKQWVDVIAIAKQERYGKVDENKKVKAHGSNTRWLYTEGTPAFDAGNRLSLPPVLELSWRAFAEALDRPARLAALRQQIAAGLAELGNKELEAKVQGYLADPRVSVEEVANKVAIKVNELREKAGTAHAQQTHQQETSK